MLLAGSSRQTDQAAGQSANVDALLGAAHPIDLELRDIRTHEQNTTDLASTSGQPAGETTDSSGGLTVDMPYDEEDWWNVPEYT